MSQMLLLHLPLLLSMLGPKPTVPRERVDWIELAGDGRAGRVATTPEFMHGDEVVYAFGGGRCRGHELGKRTLDELFEAMRSGALVKIEATRVGTGEGAQACIDAVRLFAPRP